MRMTVRDVMSAHPAAVSRNCTIRDGLEILLREAIAELYVTEIGGRLLGVVSDYEFLKGQLSQASIDEPIAGLMNCCPLTFAPDDEIATVAGVFRDGRYSRVAVVDDQGRLIGQLSRRAVLKAVAEEATTAKASSGSPPAADPPQARKPRFLHDAQAEFTSRPR